MGNRNDNRFWTSMGRYGAVHQGTKQSVSKTSQRCLLIFVHGLFGDSRRTWGRMPQWVLQNAGYDMTLVSFSYPSRSWHRSSIGQAADDLQAWLETEFRDYPHLLFVTHSTGGLVVKCLLNRSFKQFSARASSGEENEFSDSLWSRTRRVLNIAVPHFGGSPVLSWGGRVVYQIYYFCLAPLFGCLRFLTQGSLDWGKNQIIPTLTWKNPWLLKLEKDFLSHLKQANQLNQTIPIVQDIGAKSDLSVPYRLGDGKRRIYIRGTHSSIKIPKQVNAPIVSITAELLSQYQQNPGVDIVHCSLTRIGLLNRTLGTEQLISAERGEFDRGLIPTGTSSAVAGTQQFVAERIISLVNRPAAQPRRLLITGAAGVGKTSVLRHIAWKLGVNYLASPTSKPLVLLIPMQQITVSQVTDTTYNWDSLWRWWLNWGRSVDPKIDWDAEWLENQFASQPVVVLLDGVDDFLQIHRAIGFSSVVALLRDTESRYPNNPNLSIVVGIRNTLHGIERLVNDPKDIHEILRLSVSQAKRVYPSCRDWIEMIEDRELKDFVLTPLILANFEPEGDCRTGGGPENRSDLLSQTIRAVLARSGLVRTQVDSLEIEIVHLVHAMMAISWLFFYKARGEVSAEILQREARQFAQRWEDFFVTQEQSNSGFYLETIAPEKDSILFGFSLAAEPGICENLLQRSFFVPTGPGMVRFRHRYWQEFMLGEYLALCIRMHNFNELGISAFHSRIYRMAGDSFGDRVVSQPCIRALLNHWRKNRNPFVSGNVVAFLTWSHTTIEPLAVKLLLSQLNEFEALSRLVLLGGLGYRVFVNHEKDLSVTDIRRALLPYYRQFANPESAAVDDPAACSLSWMYQQAFARMFNLEAPEIEWPGLDFTDEETLKALPMVCSVEDGQFVLDERSRSLQVAFLVPIMEAYNDPRLAIRAVHYLYYLLVACKHGVHYAGLARELPSLLTEGCEFQDIVRSFHWTPELFTFYQRCQRFHAFLESQTTQYEYGS